MWILILIFLVFFLIKYIRFKKEAIKIELDSVTFFQGSLGSGKTRLLTSMAIKLFNKKYRLFKLHNLLQIISFGLYKSKVNLPLVYSNFPIFINKKIGFSKVINTSVLNWEYKIEQDSIVVLDEVGYIFPNQKEKTSDDYTFGITWLRHATNATILCASQSLSECNISFRRKVNRCYHLHDSKKFFMSLSSVEVIPVIISEDIKNVYSSNLDNALNKRYLYLNPKKNFNSRYGACLYNLDPNTRLRVASNFNDLLLILGYKNGDTWRSLYYDL